MGSQTDLSLRPAASLQGRQKRNSSAEVRELGSLTLPRDLSFRPQSPNMGTGGQDPASSEW